MSSESEKRSYPINTSRYSSPWNLLKKDGGAIFTEVGSSFVIGSIAGGVIDLVKAAGKGSVLKAQYSTSIGRFSGLSTLALMGGNHAAYVLRGRPQQRYLVDDLAVNMLTAAVFLSPYGPRTALFAAVVLGATTLAFSPNR